MKTGHFTRIESDAEAGFPDVHYTYRHDFFRPAHTGSLELKFLRKKKPPFGDDGLRLSQRIWIRDEIEAGGRVKIIAQVRDRIFILPGRVHSEFNELNELMMEHWSDLILQHRKLTDADREKFASLL